MRQCLGHEIAPEWCFRNVPGSARSCIAASSDPLQRSADAGVAPHRGWGAVPGETGVLALTGVERA